GISLPAALLGVVLASTQASGALPPTLAVTTVNAASAISAGQTLGATVAPHVVTLTEGGLKTMFVTKLKTVLAVVLALGLATAGAVVLAGVAHEDVPQAPSGFVKAPNTREPPGEGDKRDDAAKLTAELKSSADNLKKIALAMHEYHDVNNRFP